MEQTHQLQRPGVYALFRAAVVSSEGLEKLKGILTLEHQNQR